MSETNNDAAADVQTTKAVPRVHIVGRKNSGKTTLVCELVEFLTRQGLQIATVKHTHHHHELDTPGKDSHRHRESGATAVGILSPQMSAVFIPADPAQHSDDRESRYDALHSAFAHCDLVIVEGDLHTSAARIEVWRAAVSELPYAATMPEIRAVVTDDVLPADTKCGDGSQSTILPRRDLPEIANFIRSLVMTNA
ncbi:MAG: molybdopterin-guanine dinucleotide biosynthesis protein B [Planctomycetaceae bacterium]|nr:molybdopterin-guanine dinucleotide biosynthesis protein B [Planctomycetaceae bacterium]